MKMSNYFICCEECFETIGKRNTNAARLWMDVCALKLEKGEVVELQLGDFAELRILEMLGYVVSTEKENCIVLKINGHMYTEDGQHFFCVKEGRHEQVKDL